MNRYTPRSYTTLNGTVDIMERDDSGAYVTYGSHKNEIESLQARLKDLESKQKDAINTIISGYVEDAIRKSIGEVINKVIDGMMDSKPKYNGDPCHSTVDAFVNELAAGPGKTVVDDGAKFDYLTKDAKFTFGSNFGEGKALTMSVGECWSANDRKVAVCYHVNGNMFIKGCEYAYEIDECEPGCEPRLIQITQDAFCSGLKGDYRWEAMRIGKFMNAKETLGDAYAIINPDGGVVAQFYIK